MVDHLNVSYLYKKRGVFYFTKRVPCDVKSYYRSDRIVICLKTKSNVSAIRASKSLYQKLDDYWTSIRLTKMQVPAEHMLVSKPPVNSNSNAPLLSEALSTYLKLKAEGKDKIFVRASNRNIKNVIELLGNLPIAFGNEVNDILNKHFKDEFNIIKFTHYSHFQSKEVYRREVLDIINDFK